MNQNSNDSVILFKNLYGPMLIKICFYGISGLAVIGVIASMIFSSSFWVSVYLLVSIVFSIMLFRVFCELIQILFSMHRELRRINKSIISQNMIE